MQWNAVLHTQFIEYQSYNKKKNKRDWPDMYLSIIFDQIHIDTDRWDFGVLIFIYLGIYCPFKNFKYYWKNGYWSVILILFYKVVLAWQFWDHYKLVLILQFGDDLVLYMN